MLSSIINAVFGNPIKLFAYDKIWNTWRVKRKERQVDYTVIIKLLNYLTKFNIPRRYS